MTAVKTGSMECPPARLIEQIEVPMEIYLDAYLNMRVGMNAGRAAPSVPLKVLVAQLFKTELEYSEKDAKEFIKDCRSTAEILNALAHIVALDPDAPDHDAKVKKVVASIDKMLGPTYDYNGTKYRWE